MRQMQEKRKGRLLWLAALALVATAVFAASAFGVNSASIAFNPSTWDYGRITVGTSASKVFVLTNSGKGATGALTVVLNGGSSAFSVTADSCTGSKLASNKSCSVTVRYTRTSATSSDSTQLFAVSNKPLLNAAAILTGGLSSGCEAVNGDNFDDEYFSGGVNLPFKTGETVTATSSGEAGTTDVVLYSNSVAVDSTPFPGTVEYTIPEDGTYSIGWQTVPVAFTTWSTSCG